MCVFVTCRRVKEGTDGGEGGCFPLLCLSVCLSSTDKNATTDTDGKHNHKTHG